MTTKRWSDLPGEVLSQIADKLELIDLLRFRAVCKDFLSASSTATAEVRSKSLPERLWFLVYGGKRCTLLTSGGKVYDLTLKELVGATCLASMEGWLLVFREGGSMFFFNPFSHARIDLPLFPDSELSDHIAAFSSPPTSQDCTAVVVNRKDDFYLEVKVVKRGCYKWSALKIYVRRTWMSALKGAFYHRDRFSFFTGIKETSWLVHKLEYIQEIYYLPKEKVVKKAVAWRSIYLTADPSSTPQPPLIKKFKFPAEHYLGLEFYPVRKLLVKERLGLDNNVPFYTCGALVRIGDSRTIIYSEDHINPTTTRRQLGFWYRHIQAVWIEPRFFGNSNNHSLW